MTPSAGGVKVMVRRKKRSAISDLTESPKTKTPGDNMAIRFTLDLDRTTRGFEFINLLKKSLDEEEEFKDIRHHLDNEAEDRLCEFLVHKTRTMLEEVSF
ncbi:unnamed protein product [Gongylonema pulchrum]|uniref:IDEAL domain-containing protein n=1 Tax=Gongylonema pulchrum TaxID=637853 RepID=A0A183DMT5_9BILA|nr:unnamed protein product [Gongylonema pulchrum]